jgi:hypothetical protein
MHVATFPEKNVKFYVVERQIDRKDLNLWEMIFGK